METFLHTNFGIVMESNSRKWVEQINNTESPVPVLDAPLP